MICQKTSVLEGVRSQMSKAITLEFPMGWGLQTKNLPWGEGYGYWFNKYNKSFLTY